MNGNLRTDYLILVATQTPWKVAEYEAAAEYAGHHLGLNVSVLPFNYIMPHHSAVESEDRREDNLAKKSDETANAVKLLREQPNLRRSLFKAMKRHRIIFPEGVDPFKRTFYFNDDTTLAVPTPVWRHVLGELKGRVVKESLKAVTTRPEEGLPGYTSITDIGPILASTGVDFWDLLQQAHAREQQQKEKPQPLILYHQISCDTRNLYMDQAAPHTRFYAHTPFQLLEPDSYAPSLIPVTENFVCLPGDPRPIADYYGDFVQRHSTRRKIMDQFFHKIAGVHAADCEKAGLRGDFDFASRIVCNIRQKPIVVQLSEASGPKNDSKIPNYTVHRRGLPRSEKGVDRTTLIDLLSMKFKIDGNTTHADAVVFSWFDPKNEIERIYNNMMLRSAFVAKSLDSRYRYVPIIIMNKDGCYDDAIASAVSYACGGYNKNFVLEAVHNKLAPDEKIIDSGGIEHIATHAFDILNGSDVDSLKSAAKQLLDFRLSRYCRAVTPRAKGAASDEKGRPIGKLSATVFSSASSDKLSDNKNGYQIGKLLRKYGINTCTGGGDQHAFVRPLEGATKPPRPEGLEIYCASTHTIVEVETAQGCLPDCCDYWDLFDDIGPRLEALAQSDLCISIGGGDGTGQETAYFMLKQKLFPEEMQGKKLVFVGKDRSMLAEIKSLVGSENLEKMLKDPKALEFQGVYLYPDAIAAEEIIKQAREEFDAAHQPQPSFTSFAPSLIAPRSYRVA